MLVATREWFIRFLHTTKSLGVPGSSRGTLERNRVDLTVCGTGTGDCCCLNECYNIVVVVKVATAVV